MRSIFGALLCWLFDHDWGRWHAYRLADQERLGKPRTYRVCLRPGCPAKEDGPVCEHRPAEHYEGGER